MFILETISQIDKLLSVPNYKTDDIVRTDFAGAPSRLICKNKLMSGVSWEVDNDSK